MGRRQEGGSPHHRRPVQTICLYISQVSPPLQGPYPALAHAAIDPLLPSSVPISALLQKASSSVRARRIGRRVQRRSRRHGGRPQRGGRPAPVISNRHNLPLRDLPHAVDVTGRAVNSVQSWIDSLRQRRNNHCSSRRRRLKGRRILASVRPPHRAVVRSPLDRLPRIVH